MNDLWYETVDFVREMFSPENRWHTNLIILLAVAVGLLAAYMGPGQ